MAHHVIGDVHAEYAGVVVDKTCRVGGEGGQGNVDHVAALSRQGEGWSREWSLLMPPNIVEFSL